MSFVTFEEFQLRYENTVPAADEERVAVMLEDACALVVDIVGATASADWVGGSGSTTPAAIVMTVCAAVRRCYENPTGLQGETIGDYSWRVGYTGTDGSASVGLYFTKGETRIIRRAVGLSSVGTLELTGMLPDSLTEEQYVDVIGSDDPVLYFNREDLL